jgi:hypothetical protein
MKTIVGQDSVTRPTTKVSQTLSRHKSQQGQGTNTPTRCRASAQCEDVECVEARERS